MFTAQDANNLVQNDLDERIERAVREYSENSGAYLRIYHDDSFFHNIEEELTRRGFKNINVPDICIKGDVWFEW